MLSHNKWYNIFFIPVIILANYLYKIDWNAASFNPSLIHFLEKNSNLIEYDFFDLPITGTCKINWTLLSMNPNAIDLLENNKDKINRKSHDYYNTNKPC